MAIEGTLLEADEMGVQPDATEMLSAVENAAGLRLQVDGDARKQIIEDPVSELSFQFEQLSNGETRMTIYGNLPFGNRDIIFSPEGAKTGGGVSLTGLCKPAWLQEIGD